MEVVVEFELGDEVSDASRFSLCIQLSEVIAKAIEEKELEIPDGEIMDFVCYYDTDVV